MYADNGSFDVNFPTWVQDPDCGYTATLTLNGLAAPFVATDNLDGTWTIAEITNRGSVGAQDNFEWGVSLDACTGTCSATFSLEKIELHDLCETTTLVAPNDLPT